MVIAQKQTNFDLCKDLSRRRNTGVLSERVRKSISALQADIVELLGDARLTADVGFVSSTYFQTRANFIARAAAINAAAPNAAASRQSGKSAEADRRLLAGIFAFRLVR
jgi:hypothetical protein